MTSVQIAAANPTIEVSVPDVVFKPITAVVWDTEPSISPGEIAHSQELGALVREQQYDEALVRLSSSEAPLSAPFELLRGQLYSMRKDYDSAINAYKAALKLAPNFTRAHAGLGTLFLVKGDYKNAQAHLSDAVSLGAADAQTYGQLGYLNVKRGNPWGGVSAYQRALMLEPDNRQWKSGLLLALTESGQQHAALSLLGSMLNESPTNAALWQQRAALSLRDDNYISAFASLEVSLRLGADSSTNRQAAAQLAVQLGNARRAAQLASAAALSANSDLAFISQVADWMVTNGKKRYAKDILKAMSKQRGNYGAAQLSRFHYIKGRVAELDGNPNQAYTDFRLATEQDGSNGQALLAYAESALGQNRPSRAQVIYQRLEVLADYRQQAMVGQAKALIALGDYPAALQQLQKTLSEYPAAYELSSAIQSLRNIVNASRNSTS
ncbi:MAG: tetratricopeptide repeat protein [Pseudomonadota bacterium]